MTATPVESDSQMSTAGDGLVVASDGPEQTRAVAAALADLVGDGDLLVLTGDLGAGKTCFTQGFGRALGVDQRITSPTFTLANRYHGRVVLHHLDVYRLDSAADAIDLDVADLLDSGVTVIEWGDRIADGLPGDRLSITLRFIPSDWPSDGPSDGPAGGAGDDDRVCDDDRDAEDGVIVADEDNRRLIEFRAVGSGVVAQGWDRRLESLAERLSAEDGP